MRDLEALLHTTNALGKQRNRRHVYFELLHASTSVYGLNNLKFPSILRAYRMTFARVIRP